MQSIAVPAILEVAISALALAAPLSLSAAGGAGATARTRLLGPTVRRQHPGSRRAPAECQDLLCAA
jgi:hypothetical protein